MWAGRRVVERRGAAKAPWVAARKATGVGARNADTCESAASERMSVVDRILLRGDRTGCSGERGGLSERAAEGGQARGSQLLVLMTLAAID